MESNLETAITTNAELVSNSSSATLVKALDFGVWSVPLVLIALAVLLKWSFAKAVKVIVVVFLVLFMLKIGLKMSFPVPTLK